MSLSPQEVLDAAAVDDAVLALHPDYTAVLMCATGLEPGPTTPESDALLSGAEDAARRYLDGREPHDLAEIAVWRQAFLGFGIKPREARSSVEALVRRIEAGLPRIDRLTDVYNAVSVRHLVPIGGEDLAGYVGHARLVVATGDESFDTVADGEPTMQTAAPGEIVWRDDIGVTCRRWNWRQCVRTRLGGTTTGALFIIDGLGPDARERVHAASTDLVTCLRSASPDAQFTSRTLPG